MASFTAAISSTAGRYSTGRATGFPAPDSGGLVNHVSSHRITIAVLKTRVPPSFRCGITGISPAPRFIHRLTKSSGNSR